MNNRILKEFIIKIGIIIYLSATPLAISIFIKDSWENLPYFFSHHSIVFNLMFFITPLALLLTLIFYIMKNEYVILSFLVYTIISIVKALNSQTIVFDGMILLFFNLGSTILNFCVLMYFLKIQYENKFKYKISIPEKYRIEFTKFSSEIQQRGFLAILAICIGFLSVLALGKLAFLLYNNSFSVMPDKLDTLLLMLILSMYIMAGVLYFKKQSFRWVPFLISILLVIIKTIHIFHYLQISAAILPFIYLILEWKSSEQKIK